MTPDRWQKINEVFLSVVDLKTEEQKAYLEKACGEDVSLREQVETLIAADDEAGTFIAGNAADDLDHLLPDKNKSLLGESLGHYNIISILGSGGMGEVYLAEDSKLNRSIAVKTLPNSFSTKTDNVKRFQIEAKAAATLNHPNVATIYSVEETGDNQFFITMEYVEGKLLGEMLPQNGLKQRTFLEWFIAITDALAHAHEKGIVHRDIKPSNIMITHSGTPKILDFGLARIDQGQIDGVDSTLNLTKTGQILGTPAYMSPEQAEGKQADYRTDIFSLGVVMYEAITGERPFAGSNYASIVSNLMTKTPRNVSNINPEAPYLLSRLIMKCLNKEPRYRYQSMQEVRVILREINSAVDSDASLSRPSQHAKVSRSEGVSPWAFASLAALFVLVSGFAIWNVVGGTKSNKTPITKLNFQSPTGDSTDLLSAIISPDGRNFVISVGNNRSSKLLLRPLDKFETTPIEGSDGANSPFFSPDGKWVAYWGDQKHIKKLPLTGGVAQTICESCNPDQGAVWGEDGTIVFSDGISLIRFSENGGQKETLTIPNESAGEKHHRYPQFLPGGENVIFTVNVNGSNRIAVLSLKTKKVDYVEGIENAWYPKYVQTGHLLFARRKQVFAVRFDIQTLKVVGKPAVVLNGIFGFLPRTQITSDGTLVYLPATSSKENSLVWLDRKGKSTPAFEQKDTYFAPRISPDGTHMAVVIDFDIWVYEIETKKRIRLAFEGKTSYPVWTPDSKTIVFSKENQEGNEWTIFKKRADGSGDAKKILSSDSPVLPYSIHPTEEIVAFSSFPTSGKGEIKVASLVDGKTQTVIEARQVLDMPRFSPDGKWLAYYSIEAGLNQIFVKPWGGSDERFLVSKRSGVYPIWSKSGNEIIYRAGQSFYSTKVKTNPKFEAGETNLLFKGSYRTNFDLSEDGQKFLAVKSPTGVFPKHLNIVSNWTKELERIVQPDK